METAVKFFLIGCLFQGVLYGDCEWKISLPQTIKALQGSCVFIPCTFDIDQQYANYLNTAKRMWYKDSPEKIVFDSSLTQNKFKGKIFGNPTDKNCTIRFENVNQDHIGTFFFRLEATDKLKYSYKTTSMPSHTEVYIDVIASPPKPTVRVYAEGGEVQARTVLMEGSSVSLSCSAKTLCSSSPPTLTWSSSTTLFLNVSSRQQQHQGQTELISDLNFTMSHLYHRVTFSCTVTYQIQNQKKTAQETRTLHVQYAPKNTSVSVVPSHSVLEGRSVNLTCSSDANPAVFNYTWSRETEGNPEQLQTGSTLTINNTNPTHSGLYYCTAQNQHGKQNSSVLLDIQYAPKNTSVSVVPSDSVLEGRSVTLTCSSDANPAVFNYTWSRETEGNPEQLQTGSTLTINNTNPTHSGLYYCTAQNQHGQQNSSVLLDIQYAPKNTSVSVVPSDSVLEGRSVNLTCSSDANPAVFNYTWSRETEGNQEQLQTGNTLTINNTNPTHSGLYYCTAQNQHGKQNSSVLLDIQYTPKISNTSGCSRTDVIVCSCVVHGNPSPNLEWQLSGERVNNSTKTFISEVRLGSTGLRSIFTLSTPITDGLTVMCFTANKYGTSSQRFLTPPDPSFHNFSLLVGSAIGASVALIFCVIMLFYVQKWNCQPSQTRQADTNGLILTQGAVVQDSDGEYVYANKSMLSSAEVSPEFLHYSSIDFTNAEQESGEIRGISSLTTEYAEVRHHSARATEGVRSVEGVDLQSGGDAQRDQNLLNRKAEITEVSSQPPEDETYENISHH